MGAILAVGVGILNGLNHKSVKKVIAKKNQDILGRKDIMFLVDSFYKKVEADEIIGYFFTRVVKLDWNRHLPKMYDFWEATLFHARTYLGNPMQIHAELNKKEPLAERHFSRWVDLFTRAVDEHFTGENAELAKTRARSIATVMISKILKPGSGTRVIP